MHRLMIETSFLGAFLGGNFTKNIKTISFIDGDLVGFVQL